MDFFKKKKESAEDGEGGEILPVIPQEIYEAGVLSLQDIIAPSALQVNSNYIRIGSKVARVFFVMSYPRFLAGNWFSPVINLDKVFDISIFIHPIDTSSTLRQLSEKSGRGAKPNSYYGKKKAWCGTRFLTPPTKIWKICATNSSRPRKNFLMSVFILLFMPMTAKSLIKWKRK